MYQVEILYGLTDAHGKSFERLLDKCDMPVAGDDLDAAQKEADRYSLWEQHTARYHTAAHTVDKLPDWKERTVKKKKVYDKKYEVRPADERDEGQYVIVRVSKVT